MNCPTCQRVLYSRQQRTCGYCGAELPDECRLSAEEIAALKQEQKDIEIRRLLEEAKEEARKEQQAERRRDRNSWRPPGW